MTCVTATSATRDAVTHRVINPPRGWDPRTRETAPRAGWTPPRPCSVPAGERGSEVMARSGGSPPPPARLPPRRGPRPSKSPDSTSRPERSPTPAGTRSQHTEGIAHEGRDTERAHRGSIHTEATCCWAGIPSAGPPPPPLSAQERRLVAVAAVGPDTVAAPLDAAESFLRGAAYHTPILEMPRAPAARGGGGAAAGTGRPAGTSGKQRGGEGGGRQAEVPRPPR